MTPLARASFIGAAHARLQTVSSALDRKSTIGVSGGQVVPLVIAGKLRLANGADLRLTTSWRYVRSEHHARNDKPSTLLLERLYANVGKNRRCVLEFNTLYYTNPRANAAAAAETTRSAAPKNTATSAR